MSQTRHSNLLFGCYLQVFSRIVALRVPVLECGTRTLSTGCLKFPVWHFSWLTAYHYLKLKKLVIDINVGLRLRLTSFTRLHSGCSHETSDGQHPGPSYALQYIMPTCRFLNWSRFMMKRHSDVVPWPSQSRHTDRLAAVWIYSVSQKKTSPTFLAITRETIVGFS